MQPDALNQLRAELRQLTARERDGLVLFLLKLDLFDRDRGWAVAGFRSLWHFLLEEHHLCEPSAWRRINAMKLLRRFPQLEAPLADGRLNLTTLEIAGKVMTPENVEALILQFANLTKRKSEELLVSIQPRQVPADGIRKLPERAPARPAEVSAAPVAPSGLPPAEVAPASRPSLLLVPAAPAVEVQTAGNPSARDRARLEPVSAGRAQLRLTLDAARQEKLRRLRSLLSHKIPDGNLDAVFDQMLEDSLEKHGKRRGTVKPARPSKPSLPRPPTPGRRAPIPPAVRREVMERDGYCCTYVSPDGRRCESTWRLELHHHEPAPMTGSSTADDLTVRCRPHNQLHAWEDWGRQHVELRIRERRRKSRATSRSELTSASIASGGAPSPPVSG